jgi:HD superfamily phosphodiesterase
VANSFTGVQKSYAIQAGREVRVFVVPEQIDDLVDDAIQLFQERHFDGVYQTFYKYKITQEDIDRGRAKTK